MPEKEDCPHCGKAEAIEIVYGLPGLELVAAAMTGEVRIGGCCISEKSPTHACRSCDHEWIAQDARTPTL